MYICNMLFEFQNVIMKLAVKVERWNNISARAPARRWRRNAPVAASGHPASRPDT